MLSVAYDQCKKDVVCSRDSAKSPQFCKVSSASDEGSCAAEFIMRTTKNDDICYMTDAQFMRPLNWGENSGYPFVFIDNVKMAYTFQNGCFVSNDKKLCEIKDLAAIPFILAGLVLVSTVMLETPTVVMIFASFPVICISLGYVFGHKWNMFASTLRMGAISPHSECVMSRVKTPNGDLWINPTIHPFVYEGLQASDSWKIVMFYLVILTIVWTIYEEVMKRLKKISSQDNAVGNILEQIKKIPVEAKLRLCNTFGKSLVKKFGADGIKSFLKAIVVDHGAVAGSAAGAAVGGGMEAAEARFQVPERMVGVAAAVIISKLNPEVEGFLCAEGMGLFDSMLDTEVGKLYIAAGF